MMIKSLKPIWLALLVLAAWVTFLLFSVENESLPEPLPGYQQRIWNRSLCDHLVNKEADVEKVSGRKIHVSDAQIYKKYAARDCSFVRQRYFAHPPPTEEEMNLSIAYLIVAYKNANLIENLLKAIYMPHNVYCFHLDNKTSVSFKKTVRKIIDCLPNVFVTEKVVDVVWGTASVLQAELNCMEDLLQSDVKWKYLVSLVAQDYPLYDNRGIVKGLMSLNGTNNIESYPMPEKFAYRADSVWVLEKVPGKGTEHEGYRMSHTGVKKPPPPHNITIMKGWNHIAGTREFVKFVLYNKTAVDFYEWLQDIYIPDEVFFSSLQRHPGTPGGYHGNENPEWIMRAFSWVGNGDNRQCYGKWTRENCWLSTPDLRWVLSSKNNRKLFTQKIPFDYEENLVECLSIATEERKYPT